MSDSEFHRRLLYGWVARVHDFISAEQLQQALAACAERSDMSMSKALQQAGALAPGDAALIQALVDRKLEQHAGDAAASVAALQAVNRRLAEAPVAPAVRPSDATLTQATADFRQAPTHQATEGASGSVSRLELAGTRPDTDQAARFSIIRFHSRGNLGKVSLAKDRELPREVAVKQIREDHANLPGHRAHFLLEAEITGGLEHPNIVPVYGLGIDATGAPFYAMKFIRGESFRTAIQRYHRRRKRAAARRGAARRLARRCLRRPVRNRRSLKLLPRAWLQSAGWSAPFDLLGLQKLLSRFSDVCLALEYAHRRHVIHRDIKPENIMLGKYGETLVVDWGLAKTTGLEDERENAQQGQGDEPVLVPPSASGTAPEQEGARIGTPAYMAPEQAAGKISQMGPHSDIYALGGLLYALLTGERAFRGPGKEEIMALVREGRFDRPRARCPAAPRPLEAVCLKAMARLPQERYATARALAEDIDRWMAGERVRAWTAAWPEPRWDRFLRWVRKRQKLATAFVSTVTVGLILTTILGWQIQRQKQQAEKNFWMAKGAVDQYFTSASESTLLNEPGLLPLRRELLQQARDQYRQLLSNYAATDAVRRDHAAAHFRLGRVCETIGDWSEALAEYEAALARQQQQLAAAPGDPAQQAACGRTWTAIGRVHQQQLRWDLAEIAFKHALEHRHAALQAASQKEPPAATGPLQRELANSLMNLAQLRIRTRHAHAEVMPPDMRESIRQLLNESQRLRDEALARDPTNRPLQRDRVLGLFQLGEWELAQPRPSRAAVQAATARFQDAHHAVQRLLEATPDDIELQLLSGKCARRLADCHYQQAVVSLDHDDLQTAVASYARAEAELKPQVDRNPVALPYRHLLAGACLAQGRCLLIQAEIMSGAADEETQQSWYQTMTTAFEKIDSATHLLEGLAGLPDASPEMQLDYASSLTLLAVYHLQAVQLPDAARRAQQALSVLQALPASTQAHSAWTEHRLRALLAQADALWLLQSETADSAQLASNEQQALALLSDARGLWTNDPAEAAQAPELAFLSAGALRRQAEWWLANPGSESNADSCQPLLERAQAILEQLVAAAGVSPLEWDELQKVQALLQQLDGDP